MRILFLGDIVGKAGREIVARHVPDLRQKHKLDFVIANAENAAHGFGISASTTRDLYDCGVDCITSGNHVWDQREILGFIDKDPKLLRPANFPEGTVGRGSGLYRVNGDRTILVINLMARLFMDPLDDPFRKLNDLLQHHTLGKTVHAIFVDLHGEASSEKMAMGYYADGRISALVGTHTHTPTADTRILPNGTAYQTDAGMCGDYDSVIGMDKKTAIDRFVTKVPKERLTPAENEGTLCGVYIETDDATGKALTVKPVRIGAHLSNSKI